MVNATTIWAVPALATLLPLIVSAQKSCEYSCPTENQIGWSLSTNPSALGWESDYSIFECIYSSVSLRNSGQRQHTCSYYKTNGDQALGYTGDSCLPQGVKCSSVETPKFSAQGKYETPTWIDRERYIIKLMGHPLSEAKSST